MAIIIKAEKIKTVDGPKYKIIGFEAKSKHELPVKYIAGKYCAYKFNKTFCVHSPNLPKNFLYFDPGTILAPARLEEILKEVEVCGERLKEINDEIRKECEGWKGEIEWRI